MKINSKFKKIFLICIILMIILSFMKISNGVVWRGIAIAGIETVLVVAIQELVLVAGIAAEALLDAITGTSSGAAGEPVLLQVLFKYIT